MENGPMNPYEKQLYTVFKTFDVDNEEALDKSAVINLCDALQLEDRGTALIDTLFERRTDRVTFTQFKNGLLSVLSSGEPSTAASSPDVASTLASTPSAPAAPAHSDEDSSGREVAPKFIFGSKKYGRRSRPQRSTGATVDSPRAASVSRLDADDRRARSSQRMRYRRSASAMESRDLNSTTDGDDPPPTDFDHDQRIDCEQAVALCRDLRMDGIDRRLIQRIFENSQDTTVGEFFDRLNASLTSSIEAVPERQSSADPGGDDDDADDEDAEVTSELVVAAWERAGIPRPHRLLLELGFGAATVRPPDLERALDDELATLSEPLDERRDTRPLLLIAALAVGRLRLKRARRRADLAAAERDKLRADVAEANRRARLLAQDVDETHARMEAELAANLRRAETRYADLARQAADEAAAEREHAAELRARLEAEVARRSEAENRLREETEVEKSRADRLEARAMAAEARAGAAEKEAARLIEEARQAEEARASGQAGGSESATRELEARIEELRLEAQQLRDRNDELCGLLEMRAGPGATEGVRTEPAPCGDLSAELRSLLTSHAIEDCDSSPSSMEQKALSYSEAAGRLRAIFDGVGALSPPEGGRCGACAALDATVAQLREFVRELSECVVLPTGDEAGVERAGATDAGGVAAGTQTEPALPDRGADAPGSALVAAEQRHEEERERLTDSIKELETSLEQMREEYERCEEYWSRKLAEERAAGEAEARAQDERLAELLARVHEYERAFARPPLPPIEERAALEAQVADLEREFAESRQRAEADIRARDDELRRLRARLDRDRRRHRDYRNPAFDAADPQGPPPATPAAGPGGACGAGGGGAESCPCAALAERCGRLGACLAAVRGAGAREAAALRSRAARAEAACRRLHARLQAADLLVKDLYVENCHLAHRRAP